MTRRDLQYVGRVLPQEGAHRRAVEDVVAGRDVEPAAGRQRTEEHRVPEVGDDARMPAVPRSVGQPQPLHHSAQVGGQVAVGDADALRPSGGARGEHVVEVLVVGDGGHRGGPAGRLQGPDVDRFEVQLVPGRRVIARDEQADRRAGLHHHGPAGSAVVAVENDIGGADRHDADDRPHQLDRAFHVEGEDGVLAVAFPERGSDAAAVPGQLGIGLVPCALGDRDPVRIGRGHGLDALHHPDGAQPSGPLGAVAVRRSRHQVPQVRDRHVEVVRDRLEQGHEPRRPPPHRGCLEELAVVDPGEIRILVPGALDEELKIEAVVLLDVGQLLDVRVPEPRRR